MSRFIILGVILLIGIAAAAVYMIFPPEPVQVSAIIGEDGELTLSQTESTSQEISKGAVGFSHTAAFYSENISVELSAADGAEIYFTTDGSDPVVKKQQLYTEPIQINAGPEVRATTIKAISVTEGEVSRIHTRSFVTGTDVDDRFDEDTLVFVLSTDPYNLYDYEYGIAVPGKIYDEYVAAHPGEEIPYNAPGNYYMSGREAERDMYVEVFESDGSNVISQAAGVRVVGGYSRVVSQKSFKLIARKEYDPENGKFKYAFFDDAVNENGEPIEEYDRIVLRNGANDREFAGVRDELSQQLAQDYGFPCIQNTTPCAVFLNGEYYGYSWLHENFNEDYLATQFGGNREQYSIVENIEVPTPEEGEVIEPAHQDYLDMCAYYEKDLTDDKIFAKLCELVDIENLMQYYCLQIYIANRDWPGNNFKAYRYYPAEGEEITSEHMDGKWRFLFFDAEFGWGLYGNGYQDMTLSDLLDGSHASGESKALQALLRRGDMRQLYANTMCDIMAYAFSEEHINEVMDDLLEISDPEQLYALELGITSEWARTRNFEESRQQIRDFAANREFYVMLDMILALNTPISMYDVSATCTEGAHVYLNSQRDTNRVVYGRYLTNCDVTIRAEMFDGYEFVKWVINDVEYTTPEVTISSDMAKDGNVYAKLISEKKELLNEPVKISEICTDENAGWIKLYNPNAEAVSVGGLYLSDDALTPTEWMIPDNTIPAGGELLIVMKNNKTQEALMQLQATFSLKKRETLILSDKDGNIISAVAIPTLEEGERYVLQADGTFKVKKT
ncbi:MAG: spore coat protein CotH [Ruminococcaceae bacterium]|nr:spore coat protein CotH [Oscillospiraceae bacterium]